MLLWTSAMGEEDALDVWRGGEERFAAELGAR